MDFLLKIGYYAVSNPTDTCVTRAVLVVAGLTGLGWSFVAGHLGGQ